MSRTLIRPANTNGLPAWAYLLLIAAVTGPFLIPIFNVLLDMGDDNYRYILLGEALHTGKGFVQLDQPGLPQENLVAPGYPLIISIIMKIAGHARPIIIIKIFNCLCFWLSGVLAAWIFMKYFKIKGWIALLFAAYIFTNVYVAWLASVIYTEALFMLFSTLTLIAFLEYEKTNKRAALIMAVIFTTAAIYIRAPGFPLAAAGFLWLLNKKKYRVALVYVGTTGVLLSFWALPLMISGTFGYARLLSPFHTDGIFINLFIRWIYHLAMYLFKYIPSVFAPSCQEILSPSALLLTWDKYPIYISWQGILMGLIIIFLILIELIGQLKEKRLSIVLLFPIAYFTIISAAQPCKMRFAACLAPWIFLSASLGIRRIFGMINPKPAAKTLLCVLAFSLLFGTSLPKYAATVEIMTLNKKILASHKGDHFQTSWLSRPWNHSQPSMMVDAYAWWGDNQEQGALLVGGETPLGYFFSGRPALNLGDWATSLRKYRPNLDWPQASALLWRWVLKNNGTHVLLDLDYPQEADVCAYNGILLFSHCFDLVYKAGDPSACIFEINRPCLEKKLRAWAEK